VRGLLLEDSAFPGACQELLQRVRKIRAAPEEGGRGRRGGWVTSGPFKGHRRYVPGDEPRRVDWHAYARTGELFVKLFEAHRGRVLPLLVDLSSSMEDGSPPRWTAALRAAGALVYLGLALAERVDLVLAYGGPRWEALSLRGGGDLLEGWTFLDRARPGGRGGALAAVTALLRNRRGGTLWWISDFLPFDGAVLEHALERRFQVRGILPLVPQDGEPRLPRRVSLRGLEGEGRASLEVTAALRERVVRLWEEEMERVRTCLAGTGGGLFRLRPGRTLEDLAPAMG